MSARETDGNGPSSGVEESFLQRFNRRKLAARRGELLPDEPAAESVPAALAQEAENAEPEVLLTDADMPPVESLSKDSDYSGFLSPGVSEDLRRAALRRLWRVADTPFIDDLDVYAGDYTQFEPLGGLITREMKHRLDLEMRRQAEADAAAEAESETSQAREEEAAPVFAEATAEPGMPAEQADSGPGIAVDAEMSDEETPG